MRVNIPCAAKISSAWVGEVSQRTYQFASDKQTTIPCLTEPFSHQCKVKKSLQWQDRQPEFGSLMGELVSSIKEETV